MSTVGGDYSSPPREDGPFDLQRIVTETFVAQIDYHATVDSTNNVALKYCRGDVDRPILVLTARQTRGRGRGANQWWSAAGSLTFSLVIDPARFGLQQRRWPQASLTTGLSVCLGIDGLLNSADVQLKWPNDVFLDRRKVSGVLVETGGSAARGLVLGIGVNVNNSFADAPPELRTIATSLCDAACREFDITDVLIRVLQQIETQLRRLAADDPHLPADWQRRCALRGLTVSVNTETESTTGVCDGIDEEGALVLRTMAGPARFFGGVVTHIE